MVVEGVITGSAFRAERAALHGVDLGRHLKGEWMGLAAYQIRYRGCRSSRVRVGAIDGHIKSRVEGRA